MEVSETKKVAIVLIAVAIALSVTIPTVVVVTVLSENVVWQKTGNWGSTQAALSPDGKRMILQTFEELHLYDLSKDSPEWEFEYGAFPEGIAYSRSGDYIVAVSAYKIFLFEADDPAPVWSTDVSATQGGGARFLDISDNASTIVLGRTGYTTHWGEVILPRLYIFSRDSQEPLVEFIPGDRMNGVAITPDGQAVAMGTEDGQVYLFLDGSRTPVMNYSVDSRVNAVELSVDGSMVVAGTGDGRVLFLDPNDSKPLTRYGYATLGGEVYDIRLARDASTVFVGSSDNCVYAFDLEASDVTEPLMKVRTMIQNKLVKVTDDGRYFLTTNLKGNMDGVAILWDTGSDSMLRRIEWTGVECIDITPDGRYFLLSEVDKIVVYRNP